jgi:hypothetical protein
VTPKPFALLFGLVLATAPFAAAHAQEAPILPGYWESQDSYSVLFSGGSHDRKCLTTAMIAKFIESPSLKRYACTYASHSLQNGQAHFDGGACYSKKGRKVLSDVALRGDFAPEHFHLDARFKLVVSAGGGIGLPGTAQIDAHRLAPTCPVEASAAK